MTIGGGGGLIGVFALAAIQHSTFHCDIQHCDLRKPALQRRSLSRSLCSLSFGSLLHCHLPTSLPAPPPPLLTPPSFYIQTWEIICCLLPPLSLVLFTFLFTQFLFTICYIRLFSTPHNVSLHVSFRCIFPF